MHLPMQAKAWRPASVKLSFTRLDTLLSTERQPLWLGVITVQLGFT